MEILTILIIFALLLAVIYYPISIFLLLSDDPAEKLGGVVFLIFAILYTCCVGI